MGSKATDLNPFVHSGVITGVNGHSYTVALDPDIHCESCRAKAVCGAAESKEIEFTEPRASFALREPVQVVLRRDLGGKAVFWAYILPFLLMLLTLLATLLFADEWVAGLLSLGILVPYYLLVYVFRGYFSKTFRIQVLSIT